MMGVHGKCKLETPCEWFCLQKAWRLSPKQRGVFFGTANSYLAQNRHITTIEQSRSPPRECDVSPPSPQGIARPQPIGVLAQHSRFHQVEQQLPAEDQAAGGFQ